VIVIAIVIVVVIYNPVGVEGVADAFGFVCGVVVGYDAGCDVVAWGADAVGAVIDADVGSVAAAWGAA